MTHPKRPRDDPNQLAKSITDIAAGLSMVRTPMGTYRVSAH